MVALISTATPFLAQATRISSLSTSSIATSAALGVGIVSQTRTPELWAAKCNRASAIGPRSRAELATSQLSPCP
jgi:hypothetical protein